MGQGVPAEMTPRRPATVPVGGGAEQRTVLTLARADLISVPFQRRASPGSYRCGCARCDRRASPRKVRTGDICITA
jgi:hypothetical protein